MQAYHHLVERILAEGDRKNDRTGVGTLSIFGHQMRFNLADGFPMLTTKRLPFKLIVSELLWFLRGDTNITYLLQHQNHIWDEWAFERYVKSPDYKGPDMTDFGLRAEKDPAFKAVYQTEMTAFQDRILADADFARIYGNLGDVYGKQWRSWATRDGKTIDQIQNALTLIRTHPDSRRILVSAWNPEDIPNMALPPCHCLFQFYVSEGKLSCQLYQRSADVFLGVPFNIASYALLTHLIARETGLEVGEFVHTFGDAHLYLNHLDQAHLLLERDFKPLPTLVMASDKTMMALDVSDIQLQNYQAHPSIKAPIAV